MTVQKCNDLPFVTSSIVEMTADIDSHQSYFTIAGVNNKDYSPQQDRMISSNDSAKSVKLQITDDGVYLDTVVYEPNNIQDQQNQSRKPNLKGRNLMPILSHIGEKWMCCEQIKTANEDYQEEVIDFNDITTSSYDTSTNDQYDLYNITTTSRTASPLRSKMTKKKDVLKGSHNHELQRCSSDEIISQATPDNLRTIPYYKQSSELWKMEPKIARPVHGDLKGNYGHHYAYSSSVRIPRISPLAPMTDHLVSEATSCNSNSRHLYHH